MLIKLAKACMRREKGAPVMVSEPTAYRMMKKGQAAIDKKFMAAYEKRKGIK